MYRFCVLRLFCFSRFLLSSFRLLFSFSLAHLAPCLLHLGPSWLHLGLLLAPSCHLGLILNHPGSILAPQNMFLEPDHHFIEVFLKVTFGHAIHMPLFFDIALYRSKSGIYVFQKSFSHSVMSFQKPCKV